MHTLKRTTTQDAAEPQLGLVCARAGFYTPSPKAFPDEIVVLEAGEQRTFPAGTHLSVLGRMANMEVHATSAITALGPIAFGHRPAPFPSVWQRLSARGPSDDWEVNAIALLLGLAFFIWMAVAGLSTGSAFAVGLLSAFGVAVALLTAFAVAKGPVCVEVEMDTVGLGKAYPKSDVWHMGAAKTDGSPNM